MVVKGLRFCIKYEKAFNLCYDFQKIPICINKKPLTVKIILKMFY